MASSLDYVEDSLKRVDYNLLEFKLINHIASGSGFINVKVLVDEKEVTNSSTMKIEEQEATKVKPMFVTSSYGDKVLFNIKLDEPLKHGYHKIKVDCGVEMLGSYSVKFEGTV